MKTVLTLQITLFLLIAVGFVVKKMHIVGYQGQKNLNDLVIYVTSFMHLQKEPQMVRYLYSIWRYCLYL